MHILSVYHKQLYKLTALSCSRVCILNPALIQIEPHWTAKFVRSYKQTRLLKSLRDGIPCILNYFIPNILEPNKPH